MEGPNYYEILGLTEEDKNLSEEAFQKKLKECFRKKAIYYHPDKWANATEEERKEAEEQFKKVNEANSILSDPQKRAAYDNGGDDGFGGMSEFFRQHMENFYNMGKQERAPRGINYKVYVSLTLEECVKGCSKVIEVDRDIPCSACNGTGSKDGQKHKCPHCGGTGYIVTRTQRGFTLFQSSAPCPHCHGTGVVISDPCDKCRGTGFEKEHISLKINIPSGVQEGNTMCLKGKGGVVDGVAGDIFVIIQEIRDERYEREGLDILYHVDIDLYEAWCGEKIEVKTFDGNIIKLKVPELSPDGKILRLKGKGLTINGQTGDMYVNLHYIIPKKLTNEQKKLLKQFYKK